MEGGGQWGVLWAKETIMTASMSLFRLVEISSNGLDSVEEVIGLGSISWPLEERS